MKNAFYIGPVFHKRYTPKTHSLTYQVYTLLVDLDDIDQLARDTRFFSHNRFNLLSLYDKDYGAKGDGATLKDKIINLLTSEGIAADCTETKIEMLTYPRVLGYAFNPLTVFYCRRADGSPLAVIYEVSNTFKERHYYVFEVPAGADFTAAHESHKIFHVSPFFDRTGDYRFDITPASDTVSTVITYSKDGEKRLTASFKGQRCAVTDRQILKLMVVFPLMTAKVFLGILWEAFKLWRKGLKIYSHPQKDPRASSKAHVSTNKRYSENHLQGTERP